MFFIFFTLHFYIRLLSVTPARFLRQPSMDEVCTKKKKKKLGPGRGDKVRLRGLLKVNVKACFTTCLLILVYTTNCSFTGGSRRLLNYLSTKAWHVDTLYLLE
jgi:hypothetical protein